MDHLQVSANFSETDTTSLRVGQRATVTLNAQPDVEISGKVIAIDETSTTVNQVVNYGVTIRLSDAPKNVRVGQTVVAQVVTGQAQDVLLVPSAAVTTAGGQSTVTVVQNGQQVSTPVEVGLEGDQFTEITSGLSEGDEVVIATATDTGGPGGFPGGGFPGGGAIDRRIRRSTVIPDQHPRAEAIRAPIIELVDVRKTYGEGEAAVHAVRGVSLRVEPGEYVALMGASGSGKSTLMHIIGCLDVATSGSYRLDGIDVGNLDETQLALVRNRKVGFVFQAFNLLRRISTLKNVELPLAYAGMPRAERRRRAIAALEIVGLAELIDRVPQTLSGGQQQRVAIARALVTSPSLLLADEPTGNLDSESTEEVLDVIDGLHARGSTIVIVTHEHDVAERTQRIVTVRDGRIIDDRATQRQLDADG